MNTTDKTKSAGHWARRLFTQSSAATVAAAENKTYFARRYHDHLTALKQTPFSALFSEPVSHQQCVGAESIDVQKSSRHGSQSRHESGLIGGSKSVLSPDDGIRSVSNAALNAQFVVLNCYGEAPDTKTFRLGRRDGRMIYYLPGQYLTLSIEINGREYNCSYSLASSPSRPHIYEITVKRDADGGIVSNWLNDHLKIGDTLNLKGPFGTFSCLNSLPIPQKILFLAAGSGIVPIMSMLRWLTDVDAEGTCGCYCRFEARKPFSTGMNLS